MRERGDGLGFALEPREGRRVRGERVRQDLDRDVAIQLRVARAVHLAHPAGAERGRSPRTGRVWFLERGSSCALPTWGGALAGGDSEWRWGVCAHGQSRGRILVTRQVDQLYHCVIYL